MKRKTQLDFFFKNKKSLQPFFGGSHLKSNPKVSRPISTKELMHVVLKSEHAKGPYSFLKIERVIISLIQNLGVKLNVKIKDVVVMSNHIHLLVRPRHRRGLQNFLRGLTGIIARKVLGAEKAKPSSIMNFFKGRPFSRIVASGLRSWHTITKYFELNRFEKLGFSKDLSRAWKLADGPPYTAF